MFVYWDDNMITSSIHAFTHCVTLLMAIACLSAVWFCGIYVLGFCSLECGCWNWARIKLCWMRSAVYMHVARCVAVSLGRCLPHSGQQSILADRFYRHIWAFSDSYDVRLNFCADLDCPNKLDLQCVVVVNHVCVCNAWLPVIVGLDVTYVIRRACSNKLAQCCW